MRLPYLLLLIFLASTQKINAQGCSDAGFCSLQGIKDHSADDEPENWLKVIAGIAQGDRLYINQGLEAKVTLNDHTALGAKLTAVGISREDADFRQGLSDLFLTFNRSLPYSTDRSQHSLQAGVKIPLSFAGDGENGQPLPMFDQFSTGTTDFILGYQWSLDRWGFGTAWQQPLHPNGNRYLGTISTRSLSRKGDVLVRISYVQPISSRLKVRASLLPIFHLGQDTYERTGGERVAIAGSEGLTFNANLFVNYRVNQRYALELSYGSPLANREVIPDGLLRKYVFTLNLRVGLDK